MDRQIIFAVAIAIGSMLGFSGFFLSSAPPQPDARPAYAPEDIRQKFQQADAKKPKRKNQTTSVPQLSKSGKPSPTTTLSAGGSDDSGGDSAQDSNEEPSVSDEPQEEPPLD